MKPRPLLALLLLVLVPVLAGALLAPLVYAHVVPALFRMFPSVDSFNTPDFPRVVNRCVMAVVLVMLVPSFRVSGLGATLRASLRLDASRARTLAVAVVVGLGSMGVAYLAGWLLGGYRISDDVRGWPHALSRAALFLGGSVFIGVFEETFFRGFVFGALRTRLGFWIAAVLASLFFMSLHFLHPPVPEGFDGSRWNAGLALLPQIAQGFDAARDGAFAITLFLMGLTLCRLYESDGHLWLCIGLHGGWVWAMQNGAFVLDRNWAFMRGVFGPSDYVAQGPAAIPIVAGFLAWAVLKSSKPALTGKAPASVNDD
jgi:membrane protease YdiL (CAAX protease family)